MNSNDTTEKSNVPTPVPTVKRRKTEMDENLEFLIRYYYPGVVTVGDCAHFYRDGVINPRKTASKRLVRLVHLGVVEHIGPVGSGVYRLLPLK